MIKIKAEKVVDRGEPAYKVLEIEMLQEGQLPREYVRDGNYVYVHNGDVVSRGWVREYPDATYDRVLIKGGVYLAPTFDKRLGFVRKCAARLKEINVELRKKTKKWSGEVEIVI